LHKALLTAVSLTIVLAAAPVLAQQIVAPTGVLAEQEATPYQYDAPAMIDEASGTDYALESESVDPNGYADQPGAVYGTPVPGYQGDKIEGNPGLLNLIPVKAAPNQQPDAGPGQPPRHPLRKPGPRPEGSLGRSAGRPGSPASVWRRPTGGPTGRPTSHR